MRIHPVQWLRTRSFAQVVKLAVGWPIALAVIGVALYGLLWLGAWMLVWFTVAASFDLRVGVTSWTGVVALFLVPPAVLLLLWAALRLTRRAT